MTAPEDDRPGPLDVLAIGAHPDDVELGAGASLAAAAARGLAVGLLDLTRGERATNGTPEERLAEGREAARVLGARGRWNAGLADRGLTGSPGEVRLVAEYLRAARPRLVPAPYWGDRHPDHQAAARLAAEAAFEAGLAPAGERSRGEGYAPLALLFYFINDTPPFSSLPAGRPALPPPALPGSLVLVPVDEEAYARKRRAVAAHASQFGARPGDLPTTLNNGETLRRVEARDAYFGSLAGSPWAEGFLRAGFEIARWESLLP